jgi:hypothetical protein
LINEYQFSKEPAASIFYPEEEGSRILGNVENRLPKYTASHITIPQSYELGQSLLLVNLKISKIIKVANKQIILALMRTNLEK